MRESIVVINGEKIETKYSPHPRPHVHDAHHSTLMECNTKHKTIIQQSLSDQMDRY